MPTLHYLGHATLRLEIDGLNLLTDPVYSDRVLHLRRRGPSARPWLIQQPPPDLILLSHFHLDHLHLPTLRRLPAHIPLIAPRGAGPWLRALLRRRPLIELSPGERITYHGLHITATHAEHGHRLPDPFDLAQGYLVQGSRSIYFPGDTDLFPQMADLGRQGLDVALLPVGGWGPTLGKGHLDPRRAALALQLLRPRVAIPIHWDTFRPIGRVWERMPYLHRPGPDFQRHAARHAPDTAVHILSPGGQYVLA